MIINKPRQSGKTTMLIERLKNNPKALLVVHNESSKVKLQIEYPELKDRIKNVKHGILSNNYNEILIDEIECCFKSIFNINNPIIATTTNEE